MRDATKTTHTGTLGELLAATELLKQGIYSQFLGPRFDYDILTSNGKRVEVKTAKPTHSKKTHKGKEYCWSIWQFRNYDKSGIPVQLQKGRHRQCDFYIFVCLNDMSIAEIFYIIPATEINGRLMITISRKEGHPFQKYKNNWNLLK